MGENNQNRRQVLPKQLAEEFIHFKSIRQDRTRRLPNGDFQHAYKGVTLFTNPQRRLPVNASEIVNGVCTGEQKQIELAS